MRVRLALTAAVFVFAGTTRGFADVPTVGKERPEIELTSPELREGERLPVSATCDGEAQSPALSFHGTEEAKSLVLVLDDLDAPNSPFTQWVLFDIPKEIGSVAHDGTAGTSGANGEDKTGYLAPCPQRGSGVHRYRFQLYALDTDRLGTREGASRSEVDAAMSGHVLGRATLSSLYERR